MPTLQSEKRGSKTSRAMIIPQLHLQRWYAYLCRLEQTGPLHQLPSVWASLASKLDPPAIAYPITEPIYCGKHEMPSPVVPWVAYHMINSKFLINASLYASFAFTTCLANTVHLHATRVILVIQVDKFIIFSNLFK